MAAKNRSMETMKTYSMASLQKMCMDNKDSLGIRCAGKGVTKVFLYEELAKAGLLGLEGESFHGMNEFETLIQKEDPEFHEIVKDLIESLPDIRRSHGGRKRVDTSESLWSPWMEVYREHELMLRTAETENPSVISNVLSVLQTGKWTGDTIIDNIRTFDLLFPLISYIYALENADYVALCTQGGVNGPFLLSAAALSPKKRLLAPSSTLKVSGDSQVEADYSMVLSAMPRDVLNEIMNFVPFDSYTNAILAAKSFSAAEKQNRKYVYSYGLYTLTTAQTLAMRWMQEKHETRLFTIKAPPSWGKTVLILAAAIEQLKKGKKVIIYTRKDMIHTFLREMKVMMGSRFPDMNLHKTQGGKYDILAPAISEKEQKRFKAGERADILLLSSPQAANSALRQYLDQNIIPSRSMNKYAADFVILDEAHKGTAQGSIIWDNLFRNSKTRFLMVSASDILVSRPVWYNIPVCPEVDEFFVRNIGTGIQCENIKPAAISFKMKTIEEKVPSYSIDFVEKIDLYGYAPYYSSIAVTPWWDRDAAINRLHVMKNVQKGLEGIKGNVVVFVKFLPVISGIAFKRIKENSIGWKDKNGSNIPFSEYVDFVEKNNYIWHKDPKDLAKFVKESAVKPSVLITTYGKGAVGINLNTVGTVVLTDADMIGADMFYQAISRGLRVNNRASMIRVVALTKRSLRSVMRILNHTTTEDFRDEYRNVMGLKGKNFKMGPYLTPKRVDLLKSLILQERGVTAGELYVLFGRPLKSKSEKIGAQIDSFLKKYGLLPGLDFKRLKNEVVGLNNFLPNDYDAEDVLSYFWNRHQRTTTSHRE